MKPEPYRILLEKAVRNDSNANWTPHTIDYGAFKSLLRDMAKRRALLRNLIQESPDGRLADSVLQETLAEPLLLNYQPPQQQQQSKESTGAFVVVPTPQHSDSHYHAMEQIIEASASSDAESVSHAGDAPRHVDVWKRRSKRTVMRKVSGHERGEMSSFLRTEMNKVQAFYRSQWQRLSERLEEITGQPKMISASWAEHARSTRIENTREAEDLGNEILELIAFCVINIVTTCQILIRYDAYARTFEGTPMMEYYMKAAVKNPTAFRKILYHEELVALADSFQNFCGEEPSGKFVMSPLSITDTDLEDVFSASKGSNLESPSAFHAQRDMFNNIIMSTYAAHSMSVAEKTDMTDSFIKTLRSWMEIGAYEDRLGLEPAFLTMRGKSLTDEMQQLAEWRKLKNSKQRAIFPPQTKPPPAELDGVQVYNLTLNLMSAFLYCMNYYIVEPSSTAYVNRLKAHDAMSGTLIGMVPLAAFFASIPYSMWTNRSFRSPFILSCSLLVFGNLLYSLADQFRSVKMALLGRFIAGLGAPKCIIRRYLADTTPVSLRTSVNTGYGMVVAAGSAMGPAMAVILNKMEKSVILPIIGYVTFNGLTLPGYFMAALWLTFLAIVILTFDEPIREGLEEQKRLEEMLRLSGTKRERLLENEKQTPGGCSDIKDGRTLQTIFSSDTLGQSQTDESSCRKETFTGDFELNNEPSANPVEKHDGEEHLSWMGKAKKAYRDFSDFADLVTFPVRICLGLLFAKVFTIEALASATSALTKNRYQWQVHQVGLLGFSNGCLVIPFSILIGRLSLSYQDQKLMLCLVAVGCMGFFLLIDFSDMIETPTRHYNEDHPLAVGPERYITGYFLAYLSIQSFEGVIGSTLSKVIPTSLASGTFNSGLLATLVDTFGRACGDNFISFMGFINLRQLMNLLFVPGFLIMVICLYVIHRYRDLLAV